MGCGIDVVEVARIERVLARRGARFEQRVFTEREIRACRRFARPAPHFALRFAAKEATMKAVGSGWGEGVRWRDIEALASGGAPRDLQLELHGEVRARARRLGVARPHLGVTRSRGHALAVVLLETGP